MPDGSPDRFHTEGCQATCDLQPVVLADEDDFAGMNEEWLRWFPSDPPARQGAKLPARIPGLKVSIAAIAEAG